MTTHVAAGIAAALGAAALYGAGPVAQAVAARRAAPDSSTGSLLARLVREPIWLAGLGCEIAGFLLEAYAFSVAPATLVAPVMACDTLVFVVLAWNAFGGRPSRQGVAGALGLASGVALLAVAFSQHAQLGGIADTRTQFAFVLAALFVSGCAVVGGRRALAAGRPGLAAGVFGAAAGGCYGLATMSTRQVGRIFTVHHPWHLLATPTPYVLASCSILAIAMMQRGLQAGPILAFPLTSALSSLLPVVLGSSLLADEAPSGGLRIAFVAALALLVTAVALLSYDRSLAQDAIERGNEPGGHTAPARGSAVGVTSRVQP